MRTNSNSKTKAGKPPKAKYDYPPKPRPDFPLCPNGAGYWVKKVNGKIQTFGRWGKVVNGTLTRIREDGCWQEALEDYNRKTTTPAPVDGKEPLTVALLCNKFLTSKWGLMQSKVPEISARTFGEYKATTDRLIATFGKNKLVDELEQEDFDRLRAEIARKWGPVRLGNEVVRVKSVFKHGRKSDLIPSTFKKPPKKVGRTHRTAKGKRLLTAAEIHALMAVASPQMRAMILLALNCGFGNGDCGSLTQSVIDLEGRWVDYARPKTGIERRCALWPETVKAIKTAIATRPEPKDPADSDLVFVTKYGKRWTRLNVEYDEKNMPESTALDALAPAFVKLFAKAKIPRNGRGFYCLRHTFCTVANRTKDVPAVRLIMGHTAGSNDMNAVYDEGPGDEALQAVADHVHDWLFGAPQSPEVNGGAA